MRVSNIQNKGDSWFNPYSHCITSNYGWNAIDSRSNVSGFRLILL